VETIIELLVEPLIEKGLHLAARGMYEVILGIWRIVRPGE
jgi:hypothetical protein